MVRRSREEIATEEVGHTNVTPRSALVLTTLFLAMILTPPLVQALLPAFDRPGGGLFTALDDLLRAGAMPEPEEIKRFETRVEDDSWLRDVFVGPVQELMTRAGVGNEQVYIGKEGWLFYRDSVDAVTGKGFLDPDRLLKRQRQGLSSDPLVAITHFSNQLAQRGIRLVVAPIPSKVSVHPRRLSDRVVGSPRNVSMPAFVSQLEAAGVLVFDPLPVLEAVKAQTPAYLEMDTHWSPAGMKATSRALADYVVEKGLITRGDRQYHSRPMNVSHGGDILAMLGLPPGQTLFQQQTIALSTIEEDVGSDDAEVLVVGDSFANIYALGSLKWGESGGFVEHLADALGQEVDRITINDQGAFAGRQRLAQELARGTRDLDKVKVVVYEFAERELSWGDWRVIPLPEHAAGQAKELVLEPVRVSGRVAAMTRVDDPQRSPYANVITATLLRDVQVLGQGTAPQELVVFHWGMRQRRLVDHGKGGGDVIELDLIPYDSMAAEVGSYQRLDLEGESPSAWYWTHLETADDATIQTAPAPIKTAPMVSPPIAAPPADSGLAFADFLKATHADDGGVFGTVIRGSEDWLFLGSELRSLTTGPFWGDHATLVGRATKPELRDPLPAIIDLHQQLKAADIELILVPVPAKAAVVGDLLADQSDPLERSSHFDTFYAILREQGVQVLDMSKVFMDEPQSWYLRQDTHWSPKAVAGTAAKIADMTADRQWREQTAKREYSLKTLAVEVVGDLRARAGMVDGPLQELKLELVMDGEVPVGVDRESPVLVMGDSHTLVFHAGGDLFASGAGLPDRLAYEFGFGVDLIGVRGSGSTAVRLNLLRRRDNLAGKKLVIWCFAAREFTESPSGWRKVPVIR